MFCSCNLHYICFNVSLFHTVAHYPVVDNWTRSPIIIESNYDTPRLQDVQSSEEPPPYTEVAQNGHISLMHSCSVQVYKPEDVRDQSVDLTANDLSLLETSQDHDPDHTIPLPNWDNQEMAHYSPVRANQLSHSLDVTGSRALFHPTRASSPLPGNHSPERTFPVRPRSRSVDFAPLQSLQSDEPSMTFPVRPSLPPLTQTVTTLPPVGIADGQIASREVPDILFQAARAQDRLPPLQHQLSQPTVRYVHVTQRTSGGGQIRTHRKKTKRKRMHTWHGERIAPQAAPAIEQDASNTSPIEE